MTIQQILNYLNQEHIAKSRDSKLTRVYFINGQMAITHFLKDNQRAELINENRWIIFTVDNVNTPIEVNGDDISDLKSGSSADLR
jgi:hypothetical protein